MTRSTKSAALTPDTVRTIADLARLQLTDDELERFTAQLGDVLGYVEQLNALETTGVEPLTHPLELTTALREDVARPSPGAEIMTGCAHEAMHESFKVPQVIGGG